MAVLFSDSYFFFNLGGGEVGSLEKSKELYIRYCSNDYIDIADIAVHTQTYYIAVTM